MKTRTPGFMKILPTLLILGFAVSGICAAQEVEVRLISKAPLYAGTVVELGVVATGFEGSPQPTCRVNPPPGARLAFVNVEPRRQTSISIVNGRRRMKQIVTYVFRYRLLAAQPGTVRLGPFVVTQGK